MGFKSRKKQTPVLVGTALNEADGEHEAIEIVVHESNLKQISEGTYICFPDLAHKWEAKTAPIMFDDIENKIKIFVIFRKGKICLEGEE